MTKEAIKNIFLHNKLDDAVGYIYDELINAYNKIKVPDEFEATHKTITLDSNGAVNPERLLEFMLANFSRRYFQSLAKKIFDYTEGERQVSKDVQSKFDIFYSLYPKKVNAKPALAKYKTLNPNTALHNKVVEGVLKWRYIWQKEGREKQYIPAPNVWLNQRRWEDEELNNVTLDELHSSMERVFN